MEVENKSLASDWCGRLQCKITLEPKKDAIAKMVDFGDNKTIERLNKEVPPKYELRAEAYWAMNLPENGKDYGLFIKWAHMITESKMKVNSF